jgi:hypothetical protein
MNVCDSISVELSPIIRTIANAINEKGRVTISIIAKPTLAGVLDERYTYDKQLVELQASMTTTIAIAMVPENFFTENSFATRLYMGNNKKYKAANGWIYCILH